MIYTELFASDSLPKTLSKNEICDYFKKYKHGDMNARAKLIEHNIKLVIYGITKLPNTMYETEELVSVGLIGLIKSVDTFDVSKNFEFSTYASKCIDNEILTYLRKESKYQTESFGKDIIRDGEGKELGLEDSICDYSFDLEDKYEKTEIRIEILNILNSLNKRDAEIIKLYSGFYGRPYTQEEISKIIGITRPNVNRCIKRNLEKIKNVIISRNIIDVSDRTKIKTTKK